MRELLRGVPGPVGSRYLSGTAASHGIRRLPRTLRRVETRTRPGNVHSETPDNWNALSLQPGGAVLPLPWLRQCWGDGDRTLSPPAQRDGFSLSVRMEARQPSKQLACLVGNVRECASFAGLPDSRSQLLHLLVHLKVATFPLVIASSRRRSAFGPVHCRWECRSGNSGSRPSGSRRDAFPRRAG